MRILWIAPNGGNYKKGIVKGTGGWIGALQDELTKRVPNLELGITFISTTDNETITEGNVAYLPVQFSTAGNKVATILHGIFGKLTNDEEVIAQKIKQRIDEYRPDVIHVWGIENAYASVIPLIDRPFVVHIQGLLSEYLYVYLPYGFSKHDFFKADFPVRWFLRAGNFRDYRHAQHRAAREIAMGKYVKSWIGRTDWDYTMSQMLSPGSRYFHCEEMMRGDFNGAKWQYHYDGKTIHIHSSISPEWYKGMDIVLKTAKILKDQGVNIDWHVYGVGRSNDRLKYFIKKLRIVPENVSVNFHGRVDGKTIRDGLLSCDTYVHPAYIENSSNAIAEAMMLGVPTIANAVGGNATMLRHNSGVLVAPNESYILAFAIMEMRDAEIAEGFSERALKVAKERQNADKTVETLVEIYKQVVHIKKLS